MTDVPRLCRAALLLSCLLGAVPALAEETPTATNPPAPSWPASGGWIARPRAEFLPAAAQSTGVKTLSPTKIMSRSISGGFFCAP